MITTPPVEVVVLGGGAAGSTVAGYLAKAGISVALLERARHPRYAVGESLLPHMWRFMDALGASGALEAEGFVRKHGTTACWDGVVRQFDFAAFGHPRRSLVVERDRFDELLFRHAAALGARTHEATEVTEVETDDGVCLTRARTAIGEELAIASRYVIDATGQAGLLARRDGIRAADPQGTAVALWGYFARSRHVTTGGGIHDPVAGAFDATTFCADHPHGWGWHLPQRGRASVGFVLDGAHVPAGGADALEPAFHAKVAELPYFGELLDGATFVAGSFRSASGYAAHATRFSGPGYLLVGDAAGYVDPIFAQGVQFGLYGAFLAAGTMTRILQGGGDPRPARRLYEARLAQHHALSHALARGGTDDVAVDPAVIELLRTMPRDELDLLCTAAGVMGRSAHFARIARAGALEATDRNLVLDRLRRATPAAASA